MFPWRGYICGEQATGIASLVVAVAVPLVNVLAVLCFEYFRHGRANGKAIVLGVLKNPLLIACVLGLCVAALDIPMPSVMINTVSQVAGIATPLAMIVLGAGLSFSALHESRKLIAVTVLAKLLLIPLLAVAAAALLGFRDVALVCVLCTFGTPVAVASYAMAGQMDGDERLAAQLVALSSALYPFTLFVFVYLLDLLCLI